MANPIPKPIIGAFEDIGEQVVSQIKQIPKDVGQAAMESIGLNTGGKAQGNKTVQSTTPGATQLEGSSWQQISQVTDEQTKRSIARKALEELLQPTQSTKEPSIWEKIMQEEEQKKNQAAQQKQNSGPVALPSSAPRKVPGAKQSTKAKQLGSEIGKNARQD